jgi:beta-lactamase regulating signal transducer with metallopeptidase domain
MSALANWYPGHSVLDFCVIAAATVILVTATAWMVSLFLKRHPAIRHWVLLSALVASLASPFLALGFIASGRSFINLPLLIAEDTALAPELPDEVNPSRNMQAEHGHARFLDEPAPSVVPETFLPTHRTGPAKAEAVRDNVALAEPNSPTVDPATGSTYPFRSALVAVLLIWLCGTLVVILGLFRGVLFLRRLRRSVRPITDAELGNAIDEARRLVGARSSPAIGVSSLARSPMVAGLFRPIIVIPRNLRGAIRGHQLRDILMHEIAHVERRDNLVVLLQAIARAAFWPIPFMHLLNRELERAREEICDNHVLACRDAVSYGETLLRVAHLAFGTEMPAGTVGILHWRGKLEDRIFGLIHKGRNKMTRMHPLIALGVLTLFLSASAILCGTTIIAAQPAQTATAGDDRVTESSDDDSRKAQDKRDQPPPEKIDGVPVVPTGSKAAPQKKVGVPMEPTLPDAIKAFNEKASKDQIGKDEPPITEQEVIAGIRASQRPKESDVTDKLYNAFKQIAETRQLPPGAALEALGGPWDPGGSFVYDVWFVRIEMPKEDGGTYSFKIRGRIIRSRTLQEELVRIEKKLQDLPQQARQPGGYRLEERVNDLKARIAKMKTK